VRESGRGIRGGVRWSGRDRWPRRARSHVDSASPMVVEGRSGGAAPALADSQCGGATGAAVAAGATIATPTTDVVMMTTVVATTTPTTPATATVAPTTTIITNVEGSRRSRITKGSKENGSRHCWIGVDEGRYCYPPEAVTEVVEFDVASASRVSSSRRRSL
jgi:hypothetical protein